jgi:hypothetical protein
MRRTLTILIGAVLLLAAATAAPASARIVAHLHAAGHHPKVNRNWPVTVTVRTPSGRRVSGRMDYQFLFRGEVVAHQPGVRFRHGRAHDELVFPGRAIGIPITVRFVIRTSHGTARLRYGVRVRR